MGVPDVILGCSEGVKGCFMDVSRVSEGSPKGVKGHNTGISGVLEKSYKYVTRVL